MPTTDVPFLPGRRARSCAALGTLALAAGCATPPPPPPPPPPPEPVVMEVHCAPAADAQDVAARHFFATQDRLSTLNTADLSVEANRSIDASSVQAQVDQALALAQTHVPGDAARAQAMADQIVHNTSPQADPWRGPARFLFALLSEQRRAEDQAERSAQQMRDSQRDNQRKLDQLNEKLEQLKAIERSLNTRPAPAASKPGS
jgi:hypothetical protein